MKHVLAIMLLVSGSAFAADNGSQYQWQTPADKWEVTPEIGMLNQTVKPKAAGSKDQKTTGTRISVMGEYGISEQFSAGLALATRSYSTDTTPETKETGLEDLMAFFHGRSAMGPGSLRYGLDLGFALAKREAKTNETTASSGGLSLTPFVGYEMSAAPCTYGARLSYKMFTGDRTEKNPAPAADTKYSGPTTTALSLFYEHDMAPVKLGAALEISGNSQTENTVTKAKSAGFTSTGLKLYVPYEINQMITLLPEFTYMKYTAVDSTSIDSASAWQLAVGGRFQF